MNLTNNTKGLPPFVSGFALQNYAAAEKGIIEANKYGYHYFYIDVSLKEEAPTKWDKNRINLMIEMIVNYKVHP